MTKTKSSSDLLSGSLTVGDYPCGGLTAQDVDGKSTHILPPADGTSILDTDRFSFGAPGTSTIASIFNCGSKIHFVQPATKIKQLTTADLAPLIDSLALRDPATWRVVTHQCIVV